MSTLTLYMSPSLDETRTRLRFILEEFKRDAEEIVDRAVTPQFVRDLPEVTRVGQVISFLMLGVVIPVSLQLIVVLNELMTEIFLAGDIASTQQAIFAWIVTGATLGFFILAVWGWFQFVRTAGFGYFDWAENPGGPR